MRPMNQRSFSSLEGLSPILLSPLSPLCLLSYVSLYCPLLCLAYALIHLFVISSFAPSSCVSILDSLYCLFLTALRDAPP